MLRYTIKRLINLVITLFIMVTLLFIVLEFLPGSPFNDPKMSLEQVAALEKMYGLSDPFIVRYFRYMFELLQGNLGVSFKQQGRPVMDIILSPLGYTIKIVMISLSIGTILGILFGIIAAVYRNKWQDNVVSILSVLGVSLPSFVIGTFLLLIASDIPFLPTAFAPMGIGGNTLGDELISSILPVTALSISIISSVMRYMRTELVEVLASDYILLARSKGLNNREVIVRHGIRNALIPVITVLGPLAVGLLGGSTIIERFFTVPGLSNSLITAVNTNDYFVILGISMFYSLLFMVIVLVVDLLYGVIDPRIRLAKGGK